MLSVVSALRCCRVVVSRVGHGIGVLVVVVIGTVLSVVVVHRCRRLV